VPSPHSSLHPPRMLRRRRSLRGGGARKARPGIAGRLEPALGHHPDPEAMSEIYQAIRNDEIMPITYLDNGDVYIGSRPGDNQLVRLNAKADTAGGYMTVVDTLTDLRPILDPNFVCCITPNHEKKEFCQCHQLLTPTVIYFKTFMAQVKDSFRSNLVMNDCMRPLQVEEAKYDLGGCIAKN
jgi:hypothetical protein